METAAKSFATVSFPLLQLAAFMDAGHRENDPLRNVHRMVADALEVLGDHQKVDRTFPVRRVLGDLWDQLLLYAVKIFF